MSANAVAVIGLGYVGLPLAVAFGRKFRTIGYDLSEEKVAAYRRHADPSGEVSGDELCAATGLECTSDPRRIAEADFIVVAVPTPVDAARVAALLKPGGVVADVKACLDAEALRAAGLEVWRL